MKIYEFALLVLIFSGTVTLFNTLGIFDYNVKEQGFNITEEQAQGIYRVSSGNDVDDKEGWYDKIVGGINFALKLVKFIANALKLGVNIGGIFYEYIPNEVGLALNILVTGLSWFVYAWGGMQILNKFSTKGVD